MLIEIAPQLLKSLLVMGSVVEARDAYTGGHQWRVAQFAKALGKRVNLSVDDMFLLTLGGYLHDLGKVGIPDIVLQKPSKLTEEEYAVIKTHPVIGGDLLREHPFGELALDVTLHHHERIDGQGYPEGLPGDKLSTRARIMALADTFDALTSTRPYREGMSIHRAGSVLEAGRGTQFDGDLLDRFLDLAKDGELDHTVGHSDEGRPMATCPKCGPVIAIPKSTEDGAGIACRSCGGKFTAHRDGETFGLEFSGSYADAGERRPQADLEQIDEMLLKAPRTITISAE